jgi:hypothetical protein
MTLWNMLSEEKMIASGYSLLELIHGKSFK